MLKVISPTQNYEIRYDPLGSGKFRAPRGNGRRIHLGADFVCEPGQAIVAPISGKVVREARPYEDPEEPYLGILISDGILSIKMFYLLPAPDLCEKGRMSVVDQGKGIGIAQDITKRKPEYRGMIPHIHMEVRLNSAFSLPKWPEGLLINPEVLL